MESGTLAEGGNVLTSVRMLVWKRIFGVVSTGISLILPNCFPTRLCP